MLKLAAFDFDGTIADTLPMCIKAFRMSVLPYIGYEISETEIVQMFGLNETGMVKKVVKQDWEAALKDFYSNYELLHNEIIKPIDGISDLFASLKQENIIIALITGKGRKSCDISLKKLGLADVFSEILCGSENTPNEKEHIEYLLQKYAIPKKDFCYIGDTTGDIKACREAGGICLSAAWRKQENKVLTPKELEAE
jgi:Predicted phosphatases